MMDDDVPASTSATVAAAVDRADTPLNSSAADFSPDDEELDEATAAAATAAAEATRDTLADGLVASLLRPCVDCLDASVQCTRLSQLDLKLQLDSLAAELKRLSLAQHDYLFATASPSSPQSPVTDDKTTAVTSSKTASDTCVLLDGYARRLCDARAKIAVVGNILESTQDRLRALSHRIGREHNNRRSLLEPPTVMNGSVTEDSEVEDFDDKIEEEKNANDDDNEKNQHKNDIQQVDEAVTLTTVSEPPKLS